MPAAAVIKQIPIELIRPGSQQARKSFKADTLAELAESIKESGIVQPLVLRTRVWGYEILAGERRWRAAQLAQVHEVPAVIRDDLDEDEAYVLGLIENLQRESLSPIEAAAGLKRLAELHGLTHEDIAARIGKSRVYVTHILRLLHLEAGVQTLVDEGHLSLGHAKVLSGLALAEQAAWASAVVKKRLTVRSLERQLSSERRGKPAFKPAKASDWRRLETELSDLLATPVKVHATKGGKGDLTIQFHSLDELDGLLARLGYRNE
jgi:ParB family chromosome partitioning protein